MNIWLAIWICWGAFMLGTFLVIELKSMPYHGTLSEQIWRLLGIGRNLTTGIRLRRMGFIIGWVSAFSLLTAHFFFLWF